MKHRKIEVDIEDKSLATHIGIVLDRMESDIYKLRNKWGRVTKPKTNVIFNTEILQLLHKHKFPLYYFPAIKQAILEGKVTSFKRVHRLVIPRDILETLYLKEQEIIADRDYEYALLTPIEATNKEVTREFIGIKQAVVKTKKFKPDGSNESLIDLNPVLSDSMDKEARNWYWDNLPKTVGGQGKSYGEIALKTKLADGDNDKAVIYRDTVRKSIKRHKKRVGQLR